MKIDLTKPAVEAFIASSPDCEWLSDTECVLDLYDAEPPVTLDLVFGKNGAFVDGAYKLAFDEEQGGWYMAEPIDSGSEVMRVLREAGVIAQ